MTEARELAAQARQFVFDDSAGVLTEAHEWITRLADELERIAGDELTFEDVLVKQIAAALAPSHQKLRDEK